MTCGIKNVRDKDRDAKGVGRADGNRHRVRVPSQQRDHDASSAAHRECDVPIQRSRRSCRLRLLLLRATRHRDSKAFGDKLARVDTACEDMFGRMLGPFSSCLGPQAALKCSYRSDSVARAWSVAVKSARRTERDAKSVYRQTRWCPSSCGRRGDTQAGRRRYYALL